MLLEQAAGLAPQDPEVRKELVDPVLAPLGSEPRYRDLLAALELSR